MKNLFLGILCLVGSVTLTHCAKTATSGGGGGGGTMTQLTNALNVPSVSGSSRASEDRWTFDEAGLPVRVSSAAGCETVNMATRVQNIAQMPKMMLCMFGAMEDAGLITRPANGFSYYSFSNGGQAGPPGQQPPGGQQSSSFLIRYGTFQGNLLVNGCMGGKQVMEVGVQKDKPAAGQSTVTATSSFTPPNGGQSAQTCQLVVTTDKNGNYSSGSATMFGMFTGGFSLTKGTPNIATEYYSLAGGGGSFTNKMYSQWDTTNGTTKGSFSAGPGGGSTIVNSWQNATGYACISPASGGDNFTAVNNFDLTTIVIPSSAPSYTNTWDCTDPNGSFTTISPSDPATQQAMQTKVQACLSANGSGAPVADLVCSGATQCP